MQNPFRPDDHHRRPDRERDEDRWQAGDRRPDEAEGPA